MPAGTPYPWTTQQDDRLVAGYLRGDTLHVLAQDLGVAVHLVAARVETLRAAGRNLPPRKPRWTDEQRKLLAERRRTGATLGELEIEFERTRGTITYQLRHARDLGLDIEPTVRRPPRPRGPGR